MEGIRKPSFAVSGADGLPRNEERVPASSFSWRPVARLGAFPFDKNQPLIAATMTVAEFQVSRSLDPKFSESRISKFFSAAGDRVAGWRRGEQVGLATFTSTAPCIDGVKFGDYLVAQGGLGVYEVAGELAEPELFRMGPCSRLACIG